MSFYSELADTANEMLAEFGQDVVVTTFEEAQPDPATGIVSQPSSSYTTKGVLLDYDYRNFGDTQQTYQQVSTSDKRLLLNATGVLKNGDQVLVGGVVYRANVIKTVNPAGTRVLYDVWIQA
jgi:hypothetical protein